MDVHHPGVVAGLSQRAVGRHREPLDRQNGSGIVHAMRFLTGLEGRALDLQPDHPTELTHDQIYPIVVSCGVAIPRTCESP